MIKLRCKTTPIISVIFAECDTLDTTWRNVETTQTLPVQHGTDITLYCDEHYTNMGGDKATCQDGNFVSSTSPPDCKGEYRSGGQTGNFFLRVIQIVAKIYIVLTVGR